MKEESHNHIKAVTNKIIRAMLDCSQGTLYEGTKLSVVTPEIARNNIEKTLEQMVKNIMKIEKKQKIPK